MNSIIEVFRMTEVSARVRANIIVKLGNLINDQMSMNISEPLVYELVRQLNPSHPILKSQHYIDAYEKSEA